MNSGHVDDRRFLGALIDQPQALELLSVGACIEDGVVRPGWPASARAAAVYQWPRACAAVSLGAAAVARPTASRPWRRSSRTRPVPGGSESYGSHTSGTDRSAPPCAGLARHPLRAYGAGRPPSIATPRAACKPCAARPTLHGVDGLQLAGLHAHHFLPRSPSSRRTPGRASPASCAAGVIPLQILQPLHVAVGLHTEPPAPSVDRQLAHRV
jgi:hypothetical protein